MPYEIDISHLIGGMTSTELAAANGWDAFEYAATIEDNPHPKGDILYYQWRKGFTLAADNAAENMH